MQLPFWRKSILLLLVSMLICSTCYANENIFQRARELQRNGKYDEAIAVFKDYLSSPVSEDEFTDQQ